MNTSLKYIAIWMLILVGLGACELSEGPTDEDLGLLVNTWVVDQVYIDGQEDIATDYGNYRLQINADNTYQLSDIYGQSSSGNWETTSESQLILRNAGAEEDVLIINEISAERLVLVFKARLVKETEATYQFILVPEG